MPTHIDEFAISFNRPMRALMTLLRCGPRQTSVRLDAETLRVKMGTAGWAFACTIRRDSIREARRVRGPVLAWGAHGWRGRWLVNGSSRGLVRLDVQPRARGRCLFFPLRISQLTLSLTEPDELVTALG